MLNSFSNVTMLLTLSNASGVAFASGMEILYFVSRNTFKETIENESTIPPEIRGVSYVSSLSSPSSIYSPLM